MRLRVFFTGGTIACSTINGEMSPDRSNSFALLEQYSAVDSSVEFDTATPYFILSENLGAEHWERLYECVKNARGYDGVIVVHGTDTLPYTAVYLGLKCGLCETPVVLVSAAYPLSDNRSNGLDNFRGAVDFIRAQRGRGVFAAYKNRGENVKVHRAAKLLPHAPFSDRVDSLNGQFFAEIADGRIRWNPSYSEDDFCDFSSCVYRGGVLWLRVYPAMLFPALVHTRVVLFEGYHSGTLPTSRRDFRLFCEEARARNIPVYLTGSEEGFAYESKREYDALGIRVLPPLSPVTAYVMLGFEPGDSTND